MHTRHEAGKHAASPLVLGGLPISHDEDVRPGRERLDVVRCPKLLRGCLLTLLEATHGLVAVWNTRGRLLYMNSMGRTMLGFDQQTPLVGHRVAELYAPRGREELRTHAIPACLRLGVWHGETALLDLGGNAIPVSQVLMANRIQHRGRDVTVISSIAWDIREQKQRELKLRHAATHDALTGLPNRTLLLDRLGQAIRRAARHRLYVAVLFLDLDDFKSINDTCGHEAANGLLRDLGWRLQSIVRDEDTVARYGGDEFVLVIPELRTPQDVARVKQQVQRALGESFIIDNTRVHLHASVGIATYPKDGEDAQTLLEAADSVMYDEKRRKTGVGLEGTVALQPTRVVTVS
jgi:diguanylate cyclase (GGDEF)-like protein